MSVSSSIARWGTDEDIHSHQMLWPAQNTQIIHMNFDLNAFLSCPVCRHALISMLFEVGKENQSNVKMIKTGGNFTKNNNKNEQASSLQVMFSQSALMYMKG